MSTSKRLTFTEALQQEYAQMYSYTHPDEVVDMTVDNYDNEEDVMMRYFEACEEHLKEAKNE